MRGLSLDEIKERDGLNLDRGDSVAVTLGGEAPFKIRESRIIAIECDPFTAGLDGERCKPCVRDQIATGICLGAKAREDFPVPLPRLNDYAMGLSQQNITEAKHLIESARLCKDLWVGGNANYATQHLWSYPEAGVAIDHPLEPGPTGFMIR